MSNLRRRFGEFSIEIDDLEIKRGRYTVILGPSGSGKSLLLKLLAGLHHPHSGSLLIDGKDALNVPAERRNIGLVFQEASLFPHLSARSNIAYGLRARHVPAAERKRRLDEMVTRLGIADILGRPVVSLSGGEAQKIALARALVVRPRILLLDEPLSQVDHNARLELQKALKRLQRELDLTCLHVTHDREEAVVLAEDCALMLGGRVIQAGGLDNLRDRPACDFVAWFLGVDPGRYPGAPEDCGKSCLSGSGRCDRGRTLKDSDAR
ncbi:MAG TPA: ATP-binding cassette domain-containing protein [Myxococcota bacterium]|nr:ATP-binding cassette domain-containing protein [Myxococcota bacterium]